jgi:hypothetical protein
MLTVSTSFMDFFTGAVGGVPMYHGAGGMAGQIQFGARAGGALVILGAILLLVAVFFGSSRTVLRLFPPSVLGIILFSDWRNSRCFQHQRAQGRAFCHDDKRCSAHLACRHRLYRRHDSLRASQAGLASI